MKKRTCLLPVLLLISSFQVFAQVKKGKTVFETFEWSHSWIVTKPDTGALKSILVIGDSHVERYYPVVSEMLKGQYYVSKITTSKSLGDPGFIDQLKGLLSTFSFDVIFFNNGLHGVKYTPEQYASYLPKVYRILQKNNPGAKIYWVNTTARRVPDNLGAFDPYQKDVIERNKAVNSFCAKKNIPVIDFSKLSLENISYYTKDGIHFNETGVKIQAQAIVDQVLSCCR